VRAGGLVSLLADIWWQTGMTPWAWSELRGDRRDFCLAVAIAQRTAGQERDEADLEEAEQLEVFREQMGV
jgi:hypothetical protein